MAYDQSLYSREDYEWERAKTAEEEKFQRELAAEDDQYSREQADAEAQYEREQQDEYEKWQRENDKISYTSQVLPNWTPAPYTVPKYQAYIPGAAPTYSAPAWDEGEIGSLTQKRAAGGLRDLRQQVQRVTGRRYDNPQVARMTLRDALQGYGSGIGSVLDAAGGEARGEYGQKYGYLADAAKTNYGGAMSQWAAVNEARSEQERTNFEAELEKRKAAFEASWDKWKSSIGTSTTNKTY